MRGEQLAHPRSGSSDRPPRTVRQRGLGSSGPDVRCMWTAVIAPEPRHQPRGALALAGLHGRGPLVGGRGVVAERSEHPSESQAGVGDQQQGVGGGGQVDGLAGEAERAAGPPPPAAVARTPRQAMPALRSAPASASASARRRRPRRRGPAGAGPGRGTPRPGRPRRRARARAAPRRRGRRNASASRRLRRRAAR